MVTVALVQTVLAQSQTPPAPAVGGGQLILAALLGILAVVLLISWLQVHPFLALIVGSAVVGLVGGLGAAKTIKSFTTGTGTTLRGMGVLVALGAMIAACSPTPVERTAWSRRCRRGSVRGPCPGRWPVSRR